LTLIYFCPDNIPGADFGFRVRLLHSVKPSPIHACGEPLAEHSARPIKPRNMKRFPENRFVESRPARRQFECRQHPCDLILPLALRARALRSNR
jgi:hypothetical protein